ncbi:hypothetical protein QDX13_13010 [Escherichia coli]|nr:hypothetical protein QDX13_13010 [Escherichia coli]
MMSLVSGEHNTPALSLQDESPGLDACGLMLQQSLGHLDATIIYPMAWNRNQSIPAVYIVNWVQR